MIPLVPASHRHLLEELGGGLEQLDDPTVVETQPAFLDMSENSVEENGILRGIERPTPVASVKIGVKLRDTESLLLRQRNGVTCSRSLGRVASISARRSADARNASTSRPSG